LPLIDDGPRDRLPGRVGAVELAPYQNEPPLDRGTWGRVWDRVGRAVPKGALILGVLFAVNAGAAFLARKVLAHVFGAGAETDALLGAISLTAFPVNVLILGGLVGPFLPIFVGLKGEAEDTAQEFAHAILTAAMIAMGAAVAVLFVFAPRIAPLTAPGFLGDQLDTYISLIRIVCLGQLAITASMVLGEVLVAERRFVTYGLAEFAQYAGLAAGSLVLGGVLGIYGAALGFLAGALGHLAVRLVGISRTAFRPKFSLALRTAGVGEFAVLMLPKMLSSALVGLLMLYFNQIASVLAPGSITSVSYAQDFQSTAESVIGLAFALAAFPALSAAAAAGDKRTFRSLFRKSLITIGFLSVLAAITLAVFAGTIAGLFKGGAFDDTDASRMAMVLVILAISVPFESLVELYARAIYATHNTIEPAVAVIAGFAAGVIATTVLSGSLGLAALPIGYVIFRVIHLLVLSLFLKPRMAGIGSPSRWSRAIVRNRWGTAPTAMRRSTPAGRIIVAAVMAASLAGVTLFAGSQALSKVTVFGGPRTTPWARVGGTRAPIALSQQTAAAPPTQAPSSAPLLSASAPSPSAGPTATPGIYTMDLYQDGDFVSEILDTWCVPAAMQTSINIMSNTPDTSRNTQAKLFDLAVSTGGPSGIGADPNGWALGLASLGYGSYAVGAEPKMADAVHKVVKQIALTGRPGGLIVWKGWHSWVVSGFTASADPSTTDSFVVLSLRIEDVWYPRVSDLWPRSRPPDSDVKVGALSPDYKPWSQGNKTARTGLYIFVYPEQ
jgi:putative peptidoglycan lipid II flippase